MTSNTVADFRVGNVVQAHPATDAWISGDRYGIVEKIGRKFVHVRMDRSRRLQPFLPDNLIWEMEAR